MLVGARDTSDGEVAGDDADRADSLDTSQAEDDDSNPEAVDVAEAVGSPYRLAGLGWASFGRVVNWAEPKMEEDELVESALQL